MKKVKVKKAQAVIKETLGWVTDDRKLEREGKRDNRLVDQLTERNLNNPGFAAKTALTLLALLVVLTLPSTARSETLVSAQQMFMIAQEQYGAGSPETAVTLINLARTYKEQGNYNQAVTFYRRSGELAEKIAGPDDPFLLVIFNGLATTYEAMRKYDEADAVYREVRRRGYSEWADQMEFRADVTRQV